MAAHAALPLIRTRENRPSRSQGARWTANSARCNVISFRYPLSVDRSDRSDLRALSRFASFPFLISSSSPSRSPRQSGHTLCMTRPLRRRTFCSRRSFGIRRWPLATFVADLASSWDFAWEEIYVVHGSFLRPRAIRIRAAHEENSPVIVSQRR